jgi:hypothetical protein
MSVTTEERTDEQVEKETTPEPQANADKGELFNKEEYDSPKLALQKIDDQPIDRIAIKFGGTVFLDRSDPNDIALYRRLRLGADVDLKIQANVAFAGAKGATDRDGELDVIVGQKSLRVHSLDIPAGGFDEPEDEN